MVKPCWKALWAAAWRLTSRVPTSCHEVPGNARQFALAQRRELLEDAQRNIYGGSKLALVVDRLSSERFTDIIRRTSCTAVHGLGIYLLALPGDAHPLQKFKSSVQFFCGRVSVGGRTCPQFLPLFWLYREIPMVMTASLSLCIQPQ